MKFILILEGLDCANCAEKIRSAVEKLDGVDSATMNFMAKKLTITYSGNERKIRSQAEKIVKEIEPDVKVILPESEESEEKNGAGDLIRIIIGGVIFFGSMPIPEEKFRLLQFGLLLAGYLIIGGGVLWRAVRNIFRGKVFDENFLMAIATVGAFATKNYSEAVAVMLFYQVGELFQSYAVNRSRKSIADLMDIRPDYANLKADGEIRKISPQEAVIGDIIVVQPGERIPLDGKIVSGSSMLDTSALTGESVPREVGEGDSALSGCINQNGVLEIEVTKLYGESTVSKILDLVENASSKKAEAEHFITKFARWYTPAVVIAALLLAVIPTVFFGQEFSTWLYRALVFLVISCPCALVISIPLSFSAESGELPSAEFLLREATIWKFLRTVKPLFSIRRELSQRATLKFLKFMRKALHRRSFSAFAPLRKTAPTTLLRFR